MLFPGVCDMICTLQDHVLLWLLAFVACDTSKRTEYGDDTKLTRSQMG